MNNIENKENMKEKNAENNSFKPSCENFIKDGIVYILGDFECSISRNVIPDLIKLIDEKSKQANPFIEIYINSYGGYFEELTGLLAIIQMAKNKGIKIITYNIGVANSCGSILFIHGDKRKMFRDAISVMHLGCASNYWETFEQLSRVTKHSKEHFNRIVKWYVEHSKMDKSKVEEILKDDKFYMNANTCLKLGLCDEII